MQLSSLIALLIVAGFAGWIDAIVGGGGLVQVPALLLAFPHLAPATALGTSKVAAIAGTAVAAGTYGRRTRVDLKLGIGVGVVACASAGLGALTAATVPSGMFRPLVLSVLVAVAVFMAARPRFGTAYQRPRSSRRRILLTFLVAGCLLGFYDGFIGPGTGTFLILALTGILGLDLVQSSANAKVINLVTYVGAIAVFAISDHVMWLLGAAMGVMNVIGARIGASMTLTKGTGFARIVLMLTVCGLALRLAFF
ncbi:TSUP family transporter [Streptomyces sp. NPDC002343]